MRETAPNNVLHPTQNHDQLVLRFAAHKPLVVLGGWARRYAQRRKDHSNSEDNMKEFKLKTESQSKRCEICHQSDCFDSFLKLCTRCNNIIDEIEKNNDKLKKIYYQRENFHNNLSLISSLIFIYILSYISFPYILIFSKSL